jgi:hypothetical protein
MKHDEEPRGLPVTVEDRGDHLIATATDPEVVNAHLLAPGMTVVVGQHGEVIVQPPTADDVLAVLGVAPDASAEVRDAAIADGWGGLFAPERDALEAAGLAPRSEQLP